LISVTVSFGVILCRGFGWLEPWELAAYDWFIRLRPRASVSDPRIVLIIINEEDIHFQNQWPFLTDVTLTHVLKILTQYQPRVIGVDIFRDMPVPPGYEELKDILTSNRNIIMVMKAGGETSEGIPPPVVLKDTEQFGFSDILVDPDDVVRRGLLFLGDRGRTIYSFALRLALRYLQAEGILPQPDVSDPRHMRLGLTTIRPFGANDGGYVGADARGYQFLLDFQDAPGSFPSLTLTTLLSEKIDREMLRDKIVLVGVNAESVKDFFRTPYSQGRLAERDMPGVELHAHIVNQLLRFALDGNSPLATVSDLWEGGWILFWSVVAGVIGCWVRSPQRFFQSVAAGLLILGLIALFAFLNGWWIPLIPTALAWLFSAVSAVIVTTSLSDRLSAEVRLPPLPPWLNDDKHAIDIAQYVIETDEFVNKIVASATNELRRITDHRYVSFAAAVEAGGPDTLREVVEALYLQLKNDHHFRYEDERGFDVVTGGQFIRLPQHIAQENRGTCMDLVLLFLGCLANVKLWPVYVQLRLRSENGDREVDHALTAIWLEEPYFNREVCLNLAHLHQWVANGRLLLLDCTGFVEGYPRRQYKLSFAEAREEAQKLLERNEARFAVDIRRAWETGVHVVSHF